ncbi:MAG: hypothetical protein ABSD63_15235 [Candidatus Korobacteraceae bacterium]
MFPAENKGRPTEFVGAIAGKGRYIGLAKDGQPNNFAIFSAKKNSFRAEIRLVSSPEIDQQLEAAGIDRYTRR